MHRLNKELSHVDEEVPLGYQVPGDWTSYLFNDRGFYPASAPNYGHSHTEGG